MLTAHEAGLAGVADVVVLAWAARDGRALYTFNAGDYCHLHSEYMRQGLEHAGIVVVPRQRYAVGEQLRRLFRLMNARSAEEMRNQLEFL